MISGFWYQSIGNKQLLFASLACFGFMSVQARFLNSEWLINQPIRKNLSWNHERRINNLKCCHGHRIDLNQIRSVCDFFDEKKFIPVRTSWIDKDRSYGLQNPFLRTKLVDSDKFRIGVCLYIIIFPILGKLCRPKITYDRKCISEWISIYTVQSGTSIRNKRGLSSG